MDSNDKKYEEKNENEKKETGFFGKKFFIGLGVALGATAAAIGGKLVYDHYSQKAKNKKSLGESVFDYKNDEESDAIIKKLEAQKCLKPKIVDNSHDLNFLRVNSLNEIDNKEKEVQKEKEFICPITQKIMEEPVITPYGTTYEKSAIIDWMAKNKTDFMTKKALNENMLVNNYMLKVAIKNYKESLNQ